MIWNWSNSSSLPRGRHGRLIHRNGQLILTFGRAKTAATGRGFLPKPAPGAETQMTDTSSRDPSRDALTAAGLASERIEPDENAWTRRLVLFLRVMAVLSILKGLYHWAQVTGFVGGEEEAFENQTMAWQTATIYFAVIELVAAVGLWLATPWGAVVWLTTVVSMAVIELMFPGIYGGSLLVVVVEALMLTGYLVLAWMAARERPP